MSGLSALIAKLEAATGPSRELDALIWLRVVEKPSDGRRDRDMVGRSPAYTLFIDDAITLVPTGMEAYVTLIRSGQGKAWVSAEPWNAPSAFDVLVYASPAIALCIAALRARLSMEATNV